MNTGTPNGGLVVYSSGNVGGRIYLSMPEMGVEGYGEVISIGNSP